MPQEKGGWLIVPVDPTRWNVIFFVMMRNVPI